MELNSMNIRNIAVLGHQGSGKTTLVEGLHSIVYNKEKGSIERKNTVSDYLKEEKDRGSSISTSIVPLVTGDYKLNLLDIPGQDDFIWEVISITNSVKGAVLVIDAQSKIQVGTIKHFKMLRKNNIPTMIYVNKMDKGNPSFDELYSDIVDHFGKICVPFTYPLGHEENFDGFVNVVDLKARKYNGVECVDDVIHDDKRPKILELHNTICEAVAVTNDELLDKFFGGEPLTKEEIHDGLRKSVLAGELVPIIFGSAAKNIGLHTLLEMFIDYLPNPTDLKPYTGVDENGNEVVRKTEESEPFSAYIIKTIVDPYMGMIHMLKVDSGVLKLGDEVYCPNNGQSIKVASLFTMLGKTQTNTDKAIAGDIVCISKVEGLKTGYTLCDPKKVVLYPEIKFPTAVYFKAIELKNKKDEDKINTILQRMQAEDPSMSITRNVEMKQQLVGGLSESHVEFILNKIRNNYNIELEALPPKVAYRETIRKEATAQGRYIKQSGGSGFYGVVEMKFAPADESTFTEEVFGGSVPKNYFPAVEKGFYEALGQGLLAGFPVIGVHATLLDGKYHPVDSNELAFKMAAILAFKEAYMNASPTILEPILKVKIHINKEYLGDVLGDLNNRRAKVSNLVDKEDNTTTIEATIPEAETMDYVTRLRSLTQGSGYFNREFDSYDEVPEYLKDKVIKENSIL